MVCLVLHTSIGWLALSQLETRILGAWSHAGDEVSPGDEPGVPVVEHLQVDGHGMRGSSHRPMSPHCLLVQSIDTLQLHLGILDLGGVHDGLLCLHLEVFMDIMMKIGDIASLINIHEELLGNHVPADIKMKVVVS